MNMVATGVLIAVFLFTVFSSWGWPAESRYFAQIVGVIGLALSVTYGAKQLRAKSRENEQAVPDEAEGSAAAGDQAGILWKEVALYFWVIGYMLGVWLFGVIISSALFISLFMRLVGGERWRTVVVASGATTLFLWMVFVEIFHLTWPIGLVQRWFF